jgi:hypothetical protein
LIALGGGIAREFSSGISPGALDALALHWLLA